MNRLFWSIPILLFLAQAFFTFNSTSQIRYEEAAESVRNVFWLQKGLIYDGASSNVGWYAPLLLFYNLFGFDIFIAKYFRLALSLISLFCAAALLLRLLGPKNALLPLIVIGLSPTLLYFNTLGVAYGIDLQYFPIILFLIYNLDFKKKRFCFFMEFAAWTLSMIAMESYPAFIWYLPFLGLFFLWKLKSVKEKKWHILVSLISFLSPLLLTFIFIQNRQNLIYDPILKSGIFRAGGSLGFDSGTFASNLGGFFRDIFSQADSYHYLLFKGEFSDFYPIAAVVLTLGIFFWQKKSPESPESKYILGFLLGVLFIVSLVFDPSGAPGIRRYTFVLAAFYMLFVLAWKAGISQKQKTTATYIYLGVLSLLLVHHVIVFPFNLLHLSNPSKNQIQTWFKPTPGQFLDKLVTNATQQDLKLNCADEGINCRYSEVYASVAGSCMWNHRDCKQIYGFDTQSNQFIPLSTQVWDEYYFDH
ncbi:MAG: hypothetical protein HYV39_00600 [Candidatus Levybacteria bacterium]|nr:hypothetical protein [Candidatus Levybacteria bacterium]